MFFWLEFKSVLHNNTINSPSWTLDQFNLNKVSKYIISRDQETNQPWIGIFHPEWVNPIEGQHQMRLISPIFDKIGPKED